MFFIAVLLCCLLASTVSGKTVSAYPSSSCSGPTIFEFQASFDTCYNRPVSGSCDTPLGCADSNYFGVYDLNAIMAGLNCTDFDSSFTLDSDGTFHFWSGANCEGLESKGPLINPCLPLNICGSVKMDLENLLGSAKRSESSAGTTENWWSA